MGAAGKISSEGIESVSEEEYLDFIHEAEDYLEDQNLVRKDWDDFIVVGDTHGNLEAAKNPAEYAVKRGIPILYLGDYVDRGSRQLETLAFVLHLKMERPDKVVLLRGNHETERMNRSYGFYRTVAARYSIDLFREIVSLYEKLPIAAVVRNEYFMAHGGIAKGVKELDQIGGLDHQDERYKEFFWNDPSEDIETFEPNFQRGAYHLYGEKAVKDFLQENDLSRMIRAHEVQEKGYRYYFDKRLLSIFSVPNYRGGNKGKYARVKEGKIKLIDA